eukprot:2830582-Ditylum_brightwellii.AAC.1
MNYCCYALKVELVSNTATTHGLSLHPHFLYSEPKELNNQVSTTQWPRQPKITAAMWQIWMTALQ